MLASKLIMKKCKKANEDICDNSSGKLMYSDYHSSKSRPSITIEPKKKEELEDVNNVGLFSQKIYKEVPQQLLLDDELNQEADEVGTTNPITGVKQIRKKKRNSGQEYKTSTGQIALPKFPKPSCDNCRYRCSEKIDENSRKVLCEAFWNLGDINKQADYICRFVDKHDVTRSRQNESRRKHSISYKLQCYGDNHRVCKQFFLNTLCISEKKLRVAMIKCERTKNCVSVPSLDKRCKHVPHNKTLPERIIHMETHVDSFPRISDHWCCKDSKKEYLEAKLNKESICNLDEEHCKKKDMPFKKTMCKQNLTAQNIGFFTPRKNHVITAPQKEEELEEDINNNLFSQEIYKQKVPQQLSNDKFNQQAAEVGMPNPISKQKRNNNMPELWVRKIRKMKRNSGQEYEATTGQIVPAKSPKPPCENCRHRCPEKIDEDGRKVLCEAFWNLGDINKQTHYICRFVDQHDVTRSRQSESRRKHSISYKLQYNGNNHSVCKKFFLNTLCISEKKLRVAILKCEKSPDCVPSPDKRGKHAPHNKAHPERVLHMEAHMDSFPRVDEHWCCKDTKKEYLPGTLNKGKMYNLYEEHCKKTNMVPLGRSMYNRRLTARNIDFFTPRKDKCLLHS